MVKSLLSKTLFFLLTFFSLSFSIFATDLPTELIFFDDSPITLNHQPILVDHVLYVHLRDIAQVLDLSVSYDSETQEACVQNAKYTFSYSFMRPNAFELPLLLIDNYTWVPIVSFAPLFGFEIEHNQSLFITEYIGEELLTLDFLSYTISIPLYNFIPVHSAFINTISPYEDYIDGTFSVSIESASLEHMKLSITVLPFTEIDYPKEYALLNDSKLFNFSSVPLNLPINNPIYYTYLTYDPDTFSTATTTNSYILYEDIVEKRLLIANVTLKDGVITHIEQLYVP